MYNEIIDPSTGKKVSMSTQEGKIILLNYLKVLIKHDLQMGGKKTKEIEDTNFPPDAYIDPNEEPEEPLTEDEMSIDDEIEVGVFNTPGGRELRVGGNIFKIGDIVGDGSFGYENLEITDITNTSVTVKHLDGGNGSPVGETYKMYRPDWEFIYYP